MCSKIWQKLDDLNKVVISYATAGDTQCTITMKNCQLTYKVKYTPNFNR